MPRPRSSGTARLLAAARRKSPPGFSGGWGGGPLFQDAYRARRAPTQSELAEAFKSICYACAHLNAGGLTRTPKRLYAATKSGQARPKCAVRGHRKTAADRARLRWMSKTHGYQHYFKAVEEVDEVLEHPLLQALAHPNPDFDEHGLFTHAVLSLDMLGAIFWEPEADGQPAKGVPDSFWPLLSQFVVPYRTPSGSQVESYSYFGQRYEPTQLVRCRFVGLRDPYGYGYGPAQAAFEYVGLGDQFVSVQENLLGQGFRPSAIISLKDGTMPMGRDERRRFEADVNSKWSGRSAGRVFVADGALDVKPLMFPPSDLAALQISDNALQRVANCFGVPLSLLKTEDVNLANAEAGHRQHAELGVQPRCVMLASAFTRWVHGHGGEIRKAYSRDPGWDRLFLAFDNPVVEDLERRAKIVDMQLKNGERVINEVRLEDGYDNKPWGDEPWMSNTLVQPSVAAEDREHSRTLAEQIANRPAAEPEETDEEEQDGDDAEDQPSGKSFRKGKPWREGDHRRDDDGRFSSTGGGGHPGSQQPGDKPGSSLRPPTEVGKPIVAADKASDAPIKLEKTPPIFWSRWGDWHKNAELAAKATVVRGVPQKSVNVDPDNYKLFDQATGNMFLTMMVPAAYEANSDTIYINRQAFFWGHPAESDESAAASGYASTGNPEHAIDHEVGHYMHAHAVGKDAFVGLHHKALPPADKPLVKKAVGQYAASSVNDFVAEVYAGRKAGKTYPPRVNRLYRMYGGPEDK